MKQSEAGLAAGVPQALQQIGGAVGLAVLLTISIRSAHNDLGAGAPTPVVTTNGYVTAFWVADGLIVVAF